MQFHEVAEIFPLIYGNEFVELKEDIRKYGLREPIWTYQGKIIDGRNRFRACQETKTEPRFREWDGQGSLTQFVISLNLHRRHLNSGQRAAIALDILPMLEVEAKERKAHGLTAPGKTLTQKIAEASEGESTQQAAELLGTNKQYVKDAKAIKGRDPKLFDKVKAGEKSIVQAKREIKEQERETRRDENRKKIAAAPSPIEIVNAKHIKFPTIVIDPPWDWGDEGDQDQLGRARPDYGTMSIGDLLELPVNDLADVDCHLYLWITNRSLPKGFQLLEKWGFRYVTCLTWVKPHFGMGNYFRGQSEHVLFGVKGSQMLKRKDVGTVFSAPRGTDGHSSKPNQFYSLIESCSPGPYLDMFSRNRRDGWVSWGERGIESAA